VTTRRRLCPGLGPMLVASFLASAGTTGALPARARALATREVAVVWERGPVDGRIELSDGKVGKASIGPGAVGEATSFSSPAGEPVRLELSVEGASAERGGRRAVVTVRTRTRPFSLLQDAGDPR
jgi:hypothetical protein